MILDSRGESVATYLDKKDILFYRYKGEIVYLKKRLVAQKSPEIIFADSIEKFKRYFLYTFTGEIIACKNLEYKTPFLGRSRFIADSEEYSPSNIKFYKDETGFYANTEAFNFSGLSDFNQRVRKGKINLYEEERTFNTPGGYNSGTGFYSPGYTSRRVLYYYNKGFSDLKKANYKNLSEDLADNPESILCLEKYKSISHTQTVLGFVGSGLVIVGFATLMNKTKDWDGSNNQPEPDVSGNIATIVVGASCFGVCYVLSFTKPKHLKAAINAYNN